jgi:hypothetical protein
MNPTGIFLDLTKAYDILNHRVLLSKLDAYGIRGVANLWFESYLSLQQRVEIKSGNKEHMFQPQGELRTGCHRVQFLALYYFYYI